MKTLLLSISLSFALVASAQIPQFAPKCADDNEGVNAKEIKDGEGTPWNHSVDKVRAYYNGSGFTGIVKVCAKNTGKVMSKTTFKGSYRNGLAYKYHKEGWLQWKKNYANGKEDGHQKYFYPSDVMAINNNTPGKTADLNLNRRIKQSYWAKNGKKNGKAWAYYANGDIKYLEKYDNGVKNGDQVYYYEDSIVAKKENYVNGVKDGDQVYYDEKENLIGEESWENGKQVSGYKLYTGVIQVYDGAADGFIRDEKISIFVSYIQFSSYPITEAEKVLRDYGAGWRLPTKQELNFLASIKESIECKDYRRPEYTGGQFGGGSVYLSSAASDKKNHNWFIWKISDVGGYEWFESTLPNGDILPVKTYNP
jgi:antitoxin component YwqK of YwqJK toxin-antitoxin module